MSGTGNRAGWAAPYLGDRPREVLGLTQAQEAKVSTFLGFSGKQQDGSDSNAFIMIYPGTTDPTMTDFAATPLGTIVIAPFAGTHSKMYVHKAKSDTPVVGDWEVFTAATLT